MAEAANWKIDLKTIKIFNEVKSAEIANENCELVDKTTSDNLGDRNLVILTFFSNLNFFKYLRYKE